MNIEQTKEAIRIMQAFVDGKEVEVNGMLADSVWLPAGAPCWNWQMTEYRIKPTPTFRPWTADEVPLGAILRYKGNNQSIRMLIVCNLQIGLCGYQTNYPYDYLRDEMEHSTDGGKTWLPCGVMEETE
jgi:hypothetical protein